MTSTPSREQTATIGALLQAAGRKGEAVPVRRSFVQQGAQGHPEPGPLREIVRRHDEAALDLYLLQRAVASKDPWDVSRDARVWGRAIGHGTDVDGGASIVSKTWRRLDGNYRLVRRERSGRFARITALDESGDGSEYTYPSTRYFKVPFAYWTTDDAWHHALSLPGKAALLISLSLRQPFALPAERAEDWYGISPDTIDRGLRELRDHGLLERRFKQVDDWGRSPTGKRTDYNFRLKAPFAKKRRRRRPAAKGHLAVVGE